MSAYDRGKIAILGCLTTLFVIASVVSAQTPGVGDAVALKATHHLGVPLHSLPEGTNTFDRVADGEVVTVLELSGARWFRVSVSDGRDGWVNEKYLGRLVDGEDTNQVTEEERRVWASPEQCLEVVGAGARMPRAEETVRLASWNIRWFPQGCSNGEDCPENATHIPWLACAITWMDVDALALQEILNTQSAQASMDGLIIELDGLTGGSWNVDLQACGPEGNQKVGFLWNERALELRNFTDVWEMNGAATASPGCASNLRPGRYARVSSEGGVDFHLISVHFDSGRRDRDYQNRRNATERMPFITLNSVPLFELDQDVLVIGDFNTMGRSEPPAISAGEELGFFDDELRPTFRRAEAAPQCTEYFEKRPAALDHIVASSAMSEASVKARVTGYCAVEGCEPVQDLPAAYEILSDHCPVVFDLSDKDDD